MTEVPATLPPPKINSFFEMKGEGIKDVPDGSMPYFVIAKDGLYVHRRNILGRGLGRLKTIPQHLGEIGNNGNGQFIYDAPDIPEIVCAQAVSFFRRIWEKYKTEAEVILTMNIETKEWKLFIPTQKVSGTSVNSVHNPKHIAKGWLVVGTMHSHCNFGAFHSGTDSADADDMDGVHFTIGHVDRDIPEIVAMVALSGHQFHYKPDSLGNFSKLDAASAPEWWDEYVIPTNKLNEDWRPRGWDLFEKFTPSARSEGTTKTYTYQPYSSPINTGKGFDYHSSWQDVGWSGGDYDEWESAWWTPEKGSYTDYLRTKTEELRNKREGKEAQTVVIHGPTSDIPKERALVPLKPAIGAPTDEWDAYWKQANWEDDTPEEVLTILVESDLLTDFDEENAIRDMRSEALDLTYWRRVYLEKIMRAVSAMEQMGIYIDIGLKLDDSVELKEIPTKTKKVKRGKV